MLPLFYTAGISAPVLTAGEDGMYNGGKSTEQMRDMQERGDFSCPGSGV